MCECVPWRLTPGLSFNMKQYSSLALAEYFIGREASEGFPSSQCLQPYAILKVVTTVYCECRVTMSKPHTALP
jgi:hypothetical protein